MKRTHIHDASMMQQAISVLNNDGLIVYPTDTVYGFGVDTTSKSAIDFLNQVKGRSGPVSVIAPDKEIARQWMNISETDWSSIKNIVGGATTVIVPVLPGVVHPSILGNNHSLGIRIPHQPVILELVRAFGKPLTTTSVNRTGQKPLNDPDEIDAEFGSEVDLLIQGESRPEPTASTIYRLTNGELEILRP